MDANRETAIIDYQYNLTKQDKLDAGARIAELDSVVDTLEREKKLSMSSFTAKISEAEAEMKNLSKQLRVGFEIRKAECDVVYDFHEDVVNYILPETGQIVHSRAITTEERQLNLFTETGV